MIYNSLTTRGMLLLFSKLPRDVCSLGSSAIRLKLAWHHTQPCGRSALVNLKSGIREMSSVLWFPADLQMFHVKSTGVSLCRGFTRRISPKQENIFRKKDSVSDDHELIYKAPLESYLTISQGISTVCCVLMCAAAVINYQSYIFSSGLLAELQFDGFIKSEIQFITVLIAFIISNVGIRSISGKCPLRIYHSQKSDSYAAVFVGMIPFKTYKLEFKPGDVQQVPPKGVLPWRNDRFLIGNRRVILLDNFFRVPSDLNRMLGQK